MAGRRSFSRFPVFELTVLVLTGIIGLVAFELYEVQPKMSESREHLRALRDEFFTIANFVATDADKQQSSLTNFLARRNETEAEQIRVRFRQWDRWFQERQTFAGELGRERPSQTNILNGANASLTNHLARLEEDLAPMLERIAAAHSNYAAAVGYLLLNTGKPLIQVRIATQEQQARLSKQRQFNLSRRSRLYGEAMESIMSGPVSLLSLLEAKFDHLRFVLLLALVGICFSLVTIYYRRRMAQARGLLLERADKVAKLDKLAHFGRLAQELAHEIKQPLTAISARLYTLQKTLTPGTNPAKDAAVIRSEIKRLDQVLKDFLQLARPAEPHLELLDAAGALGEIRDLMSAQLEAQTIAFQFECEEGLHFVADPGQLKQVLINLVQNAAEGLGNTGRVILRARKQVTAQNGLPGNVAVIEVEDNGPGIPVEYQSKVFDAFFSTKQDGTGLGLAIAARMIAKHHGRLEFDSDPGKRTVFRVVLATDLKGIGP